MPAVGLAVVGLTHNGVSATLQSRPYPLPLAARRSRMKSVARTAAGRGVVKATRLLADRSLTRKVVVAEAVRLTVNCGTTTTCTEYPRPQQKAANA